MSRERVGRLRPHRLTSCRVDELAVLNLLALGVATLFPRFVSTRVSPQDLLLVPCFEAYFAVSKQIDGLLDASIHNDRVT